MTDADVAVVGIGGIGSMALWRLAGSGVAVHGYEQHGIGHDRGASSGQNRRFSVQSQGDPAFTPLAVQARSLWAELESEAGSRLLETCGGIIVGPADEPRLRRAEESARLHDLPHEVLDAGPARERYPQHVLQDGEQVLVDPFGGFLRPERAVLAAVSRARALGAVVHERTRVLAIEEQRSDVLIRTADGVRSYRRVVVATGAWARRLLPHLEPYVLPRRLVQAWYAPDDAREFGPDRFPVFERLGRALAYGFPSVDCATIKIGIRLGEHPVVQDLDTPHHTISPALLDTYASIVPTILRSLHPYPVATALGFEGYVTDGRALLGPSSPGSRVVLAVGFSGSGFKFAPAMGDAAARYALGEPSVPAVAMLTPERAIAPWDDALRART